MRMSINTFKIKISCTSLRELCYNKLSEHRIIRKTLDVKNMIEILINNSDYITKSLLLTKKLNNITTYTLEFLCKEQISEEQFEIFIKNMQDVGFRSTKNIIKFINNNNPHDPVFNYDFNSITTRTKNKKNKKQKNRSTYFTHSLYIK